ncbi:hypothetical protein LIER_21647 [Lithospermum erythrorhizon]|uniref:Uncharacterized protein n=1 Tax=Lithospermum erythrorhizon TaxID=34254 RepID=A0AAV3QS67_LITER
MDGLQSWANIELKRRNVCDVDEAIAVAEDLKELKKEFPSKEKEHDKKGHYIFGGGHKNNERRNNDRWRQERRDPKCYMCDGAHWTKECPQKKVFKSLACKLEKADGETYEEKINSLIVYRRAKSGGLVYVEARVNGGTTKALIDTGATHNFISLEKASRLRIRYTKEMGWIKAVNSATQPILGVARRIPIHFGEWTGTIDVIISPMDDYHMVLGVEFFHQISSVTFEKNNTMHLHEGATTYKVPLRRDQTCIRRISTLHLYKGQPNKLLIRQADPSMRRKSQWHNPNKGSNRGFNEHRKTRKEWPRHWAS